jgi:hypothetical protein
VISFFIVTWWQHVMAFVLPNPGGSSSVLMTLSRALSIGSSVWDAALLSADANVSGRDWTGFGHNEPGAGPGSL